MEHSHYTFTHCNGAKFVDNLYFNIWTMGFWDTIIIKPPGYRWMLLILDLLGQACIDQINNVVVDLFRIETVQLNYSSSIAKKISPWRICQCCWMTRMEKTNILFWPYLMRSCHILSTTPNLVFILTLHLVLS